MAARGHQAGGPSAAATQCGRRPPTLMWPARRPAAPGPAGAGSPEAVPGDPLPLAPRTPGSCPRPGAAGRCGPCSPRGPAATASWRWRAAATLRPRRRSRPATQPQPHSQLTCRCYRCYRCHRPPLCVTSAPVQSSPAQPGRDYLGRLDAWNAAEAWQVRVVAGVHQREGQFHRQLAAHGADQQLNLQTYLGLGLKAKLANGTSVWAIIGNVIIPSCLQAARLVLEGK